MREKNGTVLTYGIGHDKSRPNCQLYCVFCNDAFVKAFPTVSCRDSDIIIRCYFNGDDEEIADLTDGNVKFYADGCVEVNHKLYKESTEGNPFVYVQDDILTDADGWLYNQYHEKINDSLNKYIFGAMDGMLKVSSDRKVYWNDILVSENMGPVVDIKTNQYGYWLLTSNGDLYFCNSDSKIKLIQNNVTAISDILYEEEYFAFADQDKKVHIWNYNHIEKEMSCVKCIVFEDVISELAIYKCCLGYRYLDDTFGIRDWEDNEDLYLIRNK